MSDPARGTLAPMILVALLAIVSLSLFGIVIALSPEEGAFAVAPQTIQEPTSPPLPSYQGGSQVVSEPGKRPQGTWM